MVYNNTKSIIQGVKSMGKVVETVTDVGKTIIGKETSAQKEARQAQEKAQTAAAQTAADEAAKLEARRIGMVNTKKRGRASLLFGNEMGTSTTQATTSTLG